MGGAWWTRTFALALAACAEVTEGGAPDPQDPVAADAGAATPSAHGPAGHGADAGEAEAGHGHGGPGCTAAGIDGVAPGCRLFADCASGEVEIACDAANETCTCTPTRSGAPRTIAFDPAFCALGDGFPSANLAAAARACGWSL